MPVLRGKSLFERKKIKEKAMQYRKFNTLQWKASALGLSTLSLPLSENSNQFEESELIEIISYCLDQGVNYLDLGYPYYPARQQKLSQLVSSALRKTNRANVKIALTLPSHSIRVYADFDQHLNEQLQWLNLERVDFCLLGRLNRDGWAQLKNAGVLNWLERAKEDGRVSEVGFSFHDSYQVLKEIIASYDRWCVSQFQYSFMDTDHVPGSSGIKYAFNQGLAVVVSEPLRRKRLIKNIPEAVKIIWETASRDYSPAEWALRWAWNHPEVSVVLGDISTLAEAQEQVALAEKAEPENLSIRDLVMFGKIKDSYESLKPIPCPTCRPCMPCPKGIDVPRIFEIYNDALMYGDTQTARQIFAAEEHRPELCDACGRCERFCTKKLSIIEYLKQVRQLLESE
jgi:predicted aldo/keto reductase-like oxidoreductase